MKQIKMLLIFILCFATDKIYSQHQSAVQHIPHNVLPIISDLKTVKTVSLCRLVLLSALIGVIGSMHKDIIFKGVYHNPFSFLAVSYLLGNYLIDTVAKYKKVNKTLTFLLMSQTINRYLLAAFAVKNNIAQQEKSSLNSFDETQFFEKITRYAGYSLEELEFFTTELIHQSTCAINDLTMDNYQDASNDHMYDLLKEKITVQQIIAASKQDPVLYQALLKYIQNPKEEHESIIETIGLLIKEQMNSFIKKNLHIFPRVG